VQAVGSPRPPHLHALIHNAHGLTSHPAYTIIKRYRKRNISMSGTIKIALAAIGALFIFGAIAIVGLNSQNSASNGSTGRNAKPNQNAVQENDVAATITYTGTAFEPDLSGIPINSYVRIRNRSTRLLNFASDPYGKQSDEPELNVGVLKPGEDKKFYVSQKGTWGYHNALDPSETGRIIAN
jgi:hypothetical protein